jgi:hypothetical protein
MIVIGFSGRARSGKDTACAAIIHSDTLAGRVLAYSFSGEILAYCQDKSLVQRGRSRDELNASELATLLKVSHDCRRYYGEDFWIKRVEERMQRDNPYVALITNIRTIAEIAWLKKLGAYHVHVQRVNEDGSTYISTDRDPNDPLETALAFTAADYYIKAGPDKQDFVRKTAVTILQDIRSNHVNKTSA